MYGTGVSYEGTLIDIGVSMDIIKKSGAWYSYNDERMGQGKEAAKDYLREHKEIAKEIDTIIRDTLMAEPETFDVVGEETHEDE